MHSRIRVCSTHMRVCDEAMSWAYSPQQHSTQRIEPRPLVKVKFKIYLLVCYWQSLWLYAHARSFIYTPNFYVNNRCVFYKQNKEFYAQWSWPCTLSWKNVVLNDSANNKNCAKFINLKCVCVFDLWKEFQTIYMFEHEIYKAACAPEKNCLQVKNINWAYTL